MACSSDGRAASTSRRTFLRSASIAVTAPIFGHAPLAVAAPRPPKAAATTALDSERMVSLANWTMRTMSTPSPVPFGCDIVHTKTGERLMRALNAVGKENDPSSHAEVRTIRLACKKIKSPSLAGYTLYTTCEPCPMCMSCILWAGMDRVVYGATIADANRFCNQIQIPATEVAARSDMASTIVDGPLEEALCLTLFTNPAMQRAFKSWTSKKK